MSAGSTVFAFAFVALAGLFRFYPARKAAFFDLIEGLR